MNPLVNQMTSFIVMDILERAKELENEGADIIHMEVGEPDFDIPSVANNAAIEALNNHNTHYTHSLGDIELRRALSVYYKKEYGVEISHERFVITSGSSPAILMLSLMLFDKDSEVIITNPGYACYKNFILAAGAKVVTLDLDPNNGFKYDIEKLKGLITPRTKAIFINSPMNPTGAVLNEDVMQKISSLNIPIISDEIYHGLVYEGKAHSILEYTDNAFVLNGFSKKYAMTGLRLGYLIAPMQYMSALQKMQQNFAICAPSISQAMALCVLDNKDADAEVAFMRNTYDKRRKYLIKRLTEMGIPPICEPNGAFYILADVRHFTSDCYRFAYRILEEAHVGVTPGIDFGSNGEGFIRLSYANSIENIEKGCNRLQDFLFKLSNSKI